MRRDQRDHSVATEPKPVHHVGQPISAPANLMRIAELCAQALSRSIANKFEEVSVQGDQCYCFCRLFF